MMCEAILAEIKELDVQAAALQQQKERLKAERALLLRERSVLYETIQAFKKQFNAEGF